MVSTIRSRHKNFESADNYTKFSLGEVYRRIYDLKLSFRRRMSGAVNCDF